MEVIWTVTSIVIRGICKPSLLEYTNRTSQWKEHYQSGKPLVFAVSDLIKHQSEKEMQKACFWKTFFLWTENCNYLQSKWKRYWKNMDLNSSQRFNFGLEKINSYVIVFYSSKPHLFMFAYLHLNSSLTAAICGHILKVLFFPDSYWKRKNDSAN